MPGVERDWQAHRQRAAHASRCHFMDVFDGVEATACLSRTCHELRRITSAIGITMLAPKPPKRLSSGSGREADLCGTLDQSPRFNMPIPIVSGGWLFAVWCPTTVQALSGSIHLR